MKEGVVADKGTARNGGGFDGLVEKVEEEEEVSGIGHLTAVSSL